MHILHSDRLIFNFKVGFFEDMSYEAIKLTKQTNYAIITLNRPDQLNALNDQLLNEIGQACQEIENDDAMKSVIFTGEGKAFAAGADIKAMQSQTFPSTYNQDFITKNWEFIAQMRLPTIAAVNGFALGGGNEIAMMCDIILASEHAKFSQPEVNLGLMPGAGGTQRLTQLVGKAKAMDLCLTGRMIGAEEANQMGLVSRVIAGDELLAEAEKLAQSLGKLSKTSLMMIKEAVLKAQELPLSQGIAYERRLFQSLFATQDSFEGMAAFTEKRHAEFKDA